ncbi:hypothetical protein swp_0868 [Shewanella piezotolerans WP3]|uniref:Uncharacterized protein n=1 Tax=Shewanella piezotolerans (strain WP3 / JCM 13877) TaxID=225849 RepID=B8CJX4_SHEPW|nr:hypothetical protein swp_0868 [Shewanella piezotolerans WP3]
MRFELKRLRGSELVKYLMQLVLITALIATNGHSLGKSITLSKAH